MSADTFPKEVHAFEAELARALDAYGATAQAAEENHGSGLRVFSIEGAPVDTDVILLATPETHGLPMPSYRAIANATFAPEAHAALLRAGVGNSFANLATISRDRSMITSQARIEPGSETQTAALMASAIMLAAPAALDAVERRRRPSLADRLKQALGWQAAAQRGPETTSAWSDADFEQLLYDNAYLGGGSLEPRGWRSELGSMRFSLQAVDGHPVFGGGLLSRLWLPLDVFTVDGTLLSLDDINSYVLATGQEPIFGTWTEDGRGYCFTSFLPNRLRAVPDLEAYWIRWGYRQADSAQAMAEGCFDAYAETAE